MRNNDPWKMAARWGLALIMFGFFMYWSVFLASLVGWSLEPRGLERITARWHILLLSVLAGLLAVISARAVLRFRLLTSWLVLAVAPACYFAVVESGAV
ncbi:hypothetical protein GIY23_02070 [Allosaccharopolyspora coralli]|uniref:Uncharacterized protein n=1 Tax=Allosaccharopolyspora coralli TaxID=2665642 RepID=A0A5Q3QAK7_9PSEU|nr:hypothetical protein [Allosaccharopolyspora coralli]QGK68505.1 hypothetical protein GIY23_02070 [Allosaccharopolyspora coralli]